VENFSAFAAEPIYKADSLKQTSQGLGGGTNMKTNFLIAAIAMISLNGFTTQAQGINKVIYGEDNRHDLYEVTNPLYRKLADSTVVLVEDSAVIQNSSGQVQIKAKSFRELMNVCSTERFADQPSGGFCSGTLIAPNLMLTAGHCITDASSCASTKFVFGYDVNVKGKYPTSVAERDVVGCKQIVYRQQVGSGADFGIILLDRAITHHAPAKLAKGRLQNEITKGTALVMIGHPAGLPTKVEDGAKVRDGTRPGFFVANTDSYGGNSGSGVFNRTTGELEGVLVRGEQDYVYHGSCIISNVCAEDGCRGEDITKVSSVIPQLPTGVHF
jgi:hypothetical protein